MISFVHPLVAFAAFAVMQARRTRFATARLRSGRGAWLAGFATAVVVSIASGQEERPPQDPPGSKRPPYEVIDKKSDGASRRSSPTPAEKFHAPKAQVWRLVMRSVLDDLRSGGPVKATLVVLLLLAFFQAIPMLLAWDFAKGSGRRLGIWLTLAAIGSWCVLPVIWIASTTAKRAGRSLAPNPSVPRVNGVGPWRH